MAAPLGDDPIRSAIAVANLKRDDKILTELERERHLTPIAKVLWEDLPQAKMTPIRLLFKFFPRDKYSPTSEAGRKLLMGLLSQLADNKGVKISRISYIYKTSLFSNIVILSAARKTTVHEHCVKTIN